MDKTAQFQKALMTDPNARKEFAADPRGYMGRHGISVPAGTNMPATIPLTEFEDAIATLKAHLGPRDISDLGADPAAISNLIQTAFPARVGPQILGEIQNRMRPEADYDRAAVATVVTPIAVIVVVAGSP